MSIFDRVEKESLLPLFGPPDVARLAAKGDLDGILDAFEYRRDWRVRPPAAGALDGVSAPGVVEPLIAALKDEVSGVARAAAVALGHSGDARAVEPLLRALKSQAADVRAAAADALGQCGDAQVVEPLMATLADKAWSVRRAAIMALGNVGDARTLQDSVRPWMIQTSTCVL